MTAGQPPSSGTSSPLTVFTPLRHLIRSSSMNPRRLQLTGSEAEEMLRGTAARQLGQFSLRVNHEVTQSRQKLCAQGRIQSLKLRGALVFFLWPPCSCENADALHVAQAAHEVTRRRGEEQPVGERRGCAWGRRLALLSHDKLVCHVSTSTASVCAVRTGFRGKFKIQKSRKREGTGGEWGVNGGKPRGFHVRTFRVFCFTSTVFCTCSHARSSCHQGVLFVGNAGGRGFFLQRATACGARSAAPPPRAALPLGAATRVLGPRCCERRSKAGRWRVVTAYPSLELFDASEGVWNKRALRATHPTAPLRAAPVLRARPPDVGKRRLPGRLRVGAGCAAERHSISFPPP